MTCANASKPVSVRCLFCSLYFILFFIFVFFLLFLHFFFSFFFVLCMKMWNSFSFPVLTYQSHIMIIQFHHHTWRIPFNVLWIFTDLHACKEQGLIPGGAGTLGNSVRHLTLVCKSDPGVGIWKVKEDKNMLDMRTETGTTSKVWEASRFCTETWQWRHSFPCQPSSVKPVLHLKLERQALCRSNCLRFLVLWHSHTSFILSELKLILVITKG